MRNSTKKIIKILLDSDDTIDPNHQKAISSAIEQRNTPVPLLTSQEVQHLLKMSKSGLRRMINAGVVVPVKLCRLTRFRQEDIETLMQEGWK